MRTSTLQIDSTKVDPIGLYLLESVLYGTAYMLPRLPLPGEVVDILSGSLESFSLVEDPQDRGTFIIINDSLIEDADRPGTFDISDPRIVESEGDPGTFVVRS